MDCRFCDWTWKEYCFDYEPDVHLHAFAHQRVLCLGCNQYLTDRDLHHMHNGQYCEGKKVLRISCPFCEAEPTLTTWEEHQKTCHTPQPDPNVCEQCGGWKPEYAMYCDRRCLELPDE